MTDETFNFRRPRAVRAGWPFTAIEGEFFVRTEPSRLTIIPPYDRESFTLNPDQAEAFGERLIQWARHGTIVLPKENEG